MVKIITDSAADFEPRELERLGVECVPLSVELGGAVYRENENLSKKMFYELLKKNGVTPKTSQPGVGELEEVFRRARGDEIVAVVLSSRLSGTYRCANTASILASCTGCYIVDSRTASAGQRILVEKAVSLRDKGMSAGAIADRLKLLRERVRLYACLDTLKYLRQGGRIGAAAAAMGTLAGIKPVISLKRNGEVTVPFKAIGIRRGMQEMIKRLKQQQPDSDYPIYVMYSGNRRVGVELALRLEGEGFKIPRRQIVNTGPVVGSHIGPGACGIVYVAKNPQERFLTEHRV